MAAQDASVAAATLKRSKGFRKSPDLPLGEVLRFRKVPFSNQHVIETDGTGCYRTQLSEVREYVRMPQVGKLAIHQLDDPAPAVACDAT